MLLLSHIFGRFIGLRSSTGLSVVKIIWFLAGVMLNRMSSSWNDIWRKETCKWLNSYYLHKFNWFLMAMILNRNELLVKHYLKKQTVSDWTHGIKIVSLHDILRKETNIKNTCILWSHRSKLASLWTIKILIPQDVWYSFFRKMTFEIVWI